MEPTEFVFATLLVQSLAALILAILPRVFLRSVKQHFLRHLALAFSALSLHLACSSIEVMLFINRFSEPLLTNGLVFLESISFMAFLAWLLMGMHSGVRQKALAASTERTIVGAAVLSGTMIGAGFVLLANKPQLADAIRLSIPYGIAAVVFLRLAWQMNGIRQQFPSLISPTLGIIAFSLVGLFMLYSSTLYLTFDTNVQPLFHAPFVSVIGLMNLTLVGLSIVIWLLENEQERSRLARIKALSAKQRLHEQAPVAENLVHRETELRRACRNDEFIL